jgi:hypothetical protein
MTSRITPPPPIQCVRLRQKRTECGSISTFAITVAPVVLNPDIVSKRALTNPVIDPLKRYGNVPRRDSITQARVTFRYPSLYSFCPVSRGLCEIKKAPAPANQCRPEKGAEFFRIDDCNREA